VAIGFNRRIEMRINEDALQMAGKQQVENLARLARYLLQAAPVDFDMGCYRASVGGIPAGPEAPACGTVGCAVGHGPAAGIEPTAKDTWTRYCSREFLKEGSVPWVWCFSASWASLDNTAESAALRILFFLRFGVPQQAYHCNLWTDIVGEDFAEVMAWLAPGVNDNDKWLSLLEFRQSWSTAFMEGLIHDMTTLEFPEEANA